MSKILTGGPGLNAESASNSSHSPMSSPPGSHVYRLGAPRAADGTGQLSAPPAGVTPRRHTSSPERPNKGMFTREERPMHDFRQSHRRSTLWSTRRHAGRDARSLSRRAEELA